MLRTDKHREVMYFILRDIFASKYAKSLAFKGWTLCYFLYKLDRFSTDLDFDLVLPIENEEEFFRDFTAMLEKHTTVKESRRKRSTYFFLLSYGEDDMNIKIEINTRIWKANRYEVVNFFGTSILAMEKGTIFANKLVAATDRTTLANRDIYDIYFFFKNHFPIHEAVILERTGETIHDYLISLLKFLKKNVEKKNLLQGLGEVLDAKRKSFVKEKLLAELEGILEFKIGVQMLDVSPEVQKKMNRIEKML